MSTEARNRGVEKKLQVLGAAGAAQGVRPNYAAFPDLGAVGAVHALYVHVPFCATKCHYCDFYSIAGHLNEADAYLAALGVEMRLWQERVGRLVPETIFVGGGTPTILDAGRLERLIGMIRGAIDPSGLREFTVEGNPNTFDADRAAALVRGGVNRVSFGAQSFVASELRTLQRDHDPENVPRAFEIARTAGLTNLNVDLIFGIPGQTLETWEYSLARALELRPEHMSCYSLIYEPNTAMTARMKRGEFTPIDEELELAMFEHVYRRMRAAGFVRYEVSNYARMEGGTTRECLHNVHYWKGSQWMAWGPSAAGHLKGHRWKNAASLAHYLEALTPAHGEAAVLPLTQLEHLPPHAWAGEVAAFWMRLSEGLAYGEFAARTGVDARPILESALAKYADMGFVELLPDRVRLTEKAVAVSNRILADVLQAFAGG